MNIRKVVSYSGLIIIFYLFSVLSDILDQYMRVLVGTTLKHVTLEIFLASLILIIFGFILGISHLVKEFQKYGRWQINSERLFILGLPTLLVTLFVNLVWSSTKMQWTQHLPKFASYIFNTGGNIFRFSAILLGFVLVTSWVKKDIEFRE